MCSGHYVLLLTRRRWCGGNRYRRGVMPDFAGTDVVCCVPAIVQSYAEFAIGKLPTWGLGHRTRPQNPRSGRQSHVTAADQRDWT